MAGVDDESPIALVEGATPVTIMTPSFRRRAGVRYADLVESHRLAECCSMVKHIRKGLSMVVPLEVRRVSAFGRGCHSNMP